MPYTRPELEDALTAVEARNFGVETLFSHHPVHRDGLDNAAFTVRWPKLSLETRIGKIACIFGPRRGGPVEVICRAYYDLCTKGRLQLAEA